MVRGILVFRSREAFQALPRSWSFDGRRGGYLRVDDGGGEITAALWLRTASPPSHRHHANAYCVAPLCCAASLSAIFLWCSSVGRVSCAKALRSGSVVEAASLLKSATASSWSDTICFA